MLSAARARVHSAARLCVALCVLLLPLLPLLLLLVRWTWSETWSWKMCITGPEAPEAPEASPATPSGEGDLQSLFESKELSMANERGLWNESVRGKRPLRTVVCLRTTPVRMKLRFD